MMEMPAMSPSFTIEDIHKLREYNYYLTKDMAPHERMDYYNSAAMKVQQEIDELRACDRAANIHEGKYAHA